ncbi:MAG: hypothetical protein JWQ87_1365 [Candidatus Sulfotelmatobacter sp.]|nr:hypothetical protein [Candidatus Sulfotelmatobacter sp.]
MREATSRILALSLLCCAGLTTAWSQSTLHIGPGAGTKCAEGCAGDPNLLVGATRVDIYQTSAGAPVLSQPVLIIFGVPSEYASRFPLMPVLGVKAVNPYPGGTITSGTATFAAGGTYGLINPVSDGFFGTMMPGQEVYGFLGLTANNSNSFTNWFGADDEYLGLAPTSFDIHVYALNADLGPNGLINVALTRNVPKGTFIVAYGQGNGKNFAVPFTEAGLKCTY